MSMRLRLVMFSALAVVIAFSGARAAESPYYKNVSDIELETAVKGHTYDKGPADYFSGDHSSSGKSGCDCPCKTVSVNGTPAPVAQSTSPAPAETASSGQRVKYILDGKPVYETAPVTTPAKAPEVAEVKTPVATTAKTPEPTATKTPTPTPVDPPTEVKKTETGNSTASESTEMSARIKTAIGQLSQPGWKEAKAFLIEAGKPAIPLLIDALTNSDAAYNLGGHTKSDSGRLSRQRTVGEVAAELLTEIVSNHSSYQGDLPGSNQAAWQAWWSKNAGSVTFATK